MRPLISVIIPVYNGSRTIDECIKHLEKCNYEKEKYEIIVVDNNSTDNTRELIQKHNVRYYFEPQKGQSAARNLGAQKALGEILAFVDADCLVDEYWLQEVENSFKTQDTSAVVGMLEYIESDPCKNLQATDYKMYWEKQKIQFNASLNKICGSNFAIRRTVFEESGGFDTNILFYEDIEFGFRTYFHDFIIRYNQNLKAKHIFLNDLNERIKKMHKHGFYEYLVFSKHRNNPKILLLMPSFGRCYFRLLEKCNNNQIIMVIIAVININTVIFNSILNVLLRLKIKAYSLYKLVMNLALFKGKLIAKLAVIEKK